MQTSCKCVFVCVCVCVCVSSFVCTFWKLCTYTCNTVWPSHSPMFPSKLIVKQGHLHKLTLQSGEGLVLRTNINFLKQHLLCHQCPVSPPTHTHWETVGLSMYTLDPAKDTHTLHSIVPEHNTTHIIPLGWGTVQMLELQNEMIVPCQEIQVVPVWGKTS